jgi:hypothetical protein
MDPITCIYTKNVLKGTLKLHLMLSDFNTKNIFLQNKYFKIILTDSNLC